MADFVVTHNHCANCGACLLQPGQVHQCPQQVRPDILAAFIADSQRGNVLNRSKRDVKARSAEGDGETAAPSAK